MSGQAGGPSARLVSLDVFRGATIAAMVLVNNPGTWEAVYPPLRHAPWHGWTFTDLVFPFFLWIVGVALTLSLGRRAAAEDRRRLWLHILRRAAILFAIGLFLNAFPYFRLGTLRIPGVLQRIAVCYLAAATIFLCTRLRGQCLWVAGLLVSYWMSMAWFPVPGHGPGVWQPVGNLAQYVDSLVLGGHMWSQTRVWDPEGIFSTLPAIATTLFGVLAGRLMRAPLPAPEKAAWMFVGGHALLVSGLAMDVWLPINKNLWTSSYAVFMAGMAASAFAVCYWLVDVQGWRRAAAPWTVLGMNAIAVFVASGLVARMLGVVHIGGTPLQQVIFRHAFAPLASPVNASLLYALANVALMYLLAWLLYRKRRFVKF